MIRSALRLPILALLAGLAAQPALAADAKDPVLATVNGTEIKASTVAAYQRSLPPQMAGVPAEALLESLINIQLVQEQAKKDGTDKDADVKTALKAAEQQIINRAWMAKKIRSEVSDEAVKKRYDKLLAEFKPSEEVKASHILFDKDDEAGAKAAIAELSKGGDFATLARSKSKDPSAKANGGDLGYFGKDDMVAEFANAAFAMKNGDLSAVPVKSQFGWHVIKVTDRRMSPPPSLDEARAPLRERMAEEVAEKLVEDLRTKAKIKINSEEKK